MIRTLQRLAWVFGLFSVLVFAGLVANAVAVRNVDPVPPTKIDHLVSRLNQDPKNEAALAEIKRQDVFLRSGFVRSQRFAGLGFLLLLGGVAGWALCMKQVRRLRETAPEPTPTAPESRAQFRRQAQAGTLATGAILAGGTLALTVLARHDAIHAYTLNSRMPEVASGASHASAPAAETAAPPLAVLAPVGGGSTPPPVAGEIPPMPVGGTSIQPLPASTPEPKPVTPSAPTATITAPKVVAGTWPGFRGVGAGAAAGSFPAAWNATTGEGVLWTAEVPLPGWNSPVLWGGRVFLSGGDGKTREVFAFNAADGKLLWRTPVPEITKGTKTYKDTGVAPATLAVDATTVVAAFANGDVIALDHEGKALWTLALGPLDNDYGYASCPVIADGKLLLQVDQGHSPNPAKSKLLALDPRTGKPVWSVGRPVQSAWSTPVVVEVSGRKLVVLAGHPLVMAYDLADGKEVWRVEGYGGEVCPSPTFGDGRIFLAQSGAIAMAINAADGKKLWENYECALPDTASPSYANGLLTFVSADGALTALDATDGKIVWENPLAKPGRASPLIADGKILVFGNDGVGRMVEVGRTFKLLGNFPMGEEVGASPALVDGRLYVRTKTKLICLGAK